MVQIAKSGSATITKNNADVTVTHGCDFTPNIDQILPTPKDNLDGRNCWISNVTAITFRINISSIDSKGHTIGYIILR